MPSNYQVPLPGAVVVPNSSIGGKRPTPVTSAQSLRAQAAVAAQFGASLSNGGGNVSTPQSGFVAGRK